MWGRSLGAPFPDAAAQRAVRNWELAAAVEANGSSLSSSRIEIPASLKERNMRVVVQRGQEPWFIGLHTLKAAMAFGASSVTVLGD